VYKLKNKKEKLCYIIVIVLIVLLYKFIGCPIKSITGISCPGCGMTRACICVVKGDFAKALEYHPMVVLMPVMAGLFIYTMVIKYKMSLAGKKSNLKVNIKDSSLTKNNCYCKISKRIDLLWIIIGCVFCVTYVIRLVKGNDIVNVAVQQGIIVRVIREIVNI